MQFHRWLIFAEGLREVSNSIASKLDMTHKCQKAGFCAKYTANAMGVLVDPC